MSLARRLRRVRRERQRELDKFERRLQKRGAEEFAVIKAALNAMRWPVRAWKAVKLAFGRLG